MFVAFGWDDNGDPSGMQWSLELVAGRVNPAGAGQSATHDGAPVSMSYYNASTYTDQTGALWKQAYDAGHEIGDHTRSHGEHLQQSNDLALWSTEIEDCLAALDDLGIARADVLGFRTPFLATSDAAITAAERAGFAYDCSLEEGFQPTQDGTNFLWPYTLHAGSPGNDQLVQWEVKLPIREHPGLWEMPVYAYLVPPDDRCRAYGVEPGLRQRLHATRDYFDPAQGKVTGFDWNLWHELAMTPDEVLATLKYSLDQRLAGNRAPMLVGLHSGEYDDAHADRRAAVEAFLDHALAHPDVRVVSTDRVLAWLRAPVPLDG
jgi:peptidoglycan/xylan/chitin deacetylase (PgdA/CDA1 family)